MATLSGIPRWFVVGGAIWLSSMAFRLSGSFLIMTFAVSLSGVCL
jgi:hypothetical protein